MRYTVNLLGYSERKEEYMRICQLKDFGIDFKGANEYARSLAYDHTEEVIAEVNRKSKILLPFMVSVNIAHNGYERPMFGYEYDGETVEKTML